MKTIDSFDGQYRFLSNFWPAQVYLSPGTITTPDGEVVDVIAGNPYPSVEAAYQASKTLEPRDREKIRNAKSPNEAKRLGNKVILRKDWENVKLDTMLGLLRQKFAIPELRTLLIDTGDAELIEGNWWGDSFWGICRGKGTNHLGRLLMQVRKEIKGELQ